MITTSEKLTNSTTFPISPINVNVIAKDGLARYPTGHDMVQHARHI